MNLSGLPGAITQKAKKCAHKQEHVRSCLCGLLHRYMQEILFRQNTPEHPTGY